MASVCFGRERYDPALVVVPYSITQQKPRSRDCEAFDCTIDI